MHSHLRFENPPGAPHEVVVEVVERALGDRCQKGEAASVLVGIALNDDAQAFVEYWCVQGGTRAVAGSPLLGLAVLCLGHIARRFRCLSGETLALAEALAARARVDPSDVDGRVLDGLDDIRSFLRRGQAG